jgi:hypothetical protein
MICQSSDAREWCAVGRSRRKVWRLWVERERYLGLGKGRAGNLSDSQLSYEDTSIRVRDQSQQVAALYSVRVEDVEPQRSKVVVIGVRPEQTQTPVAINVIVPTDKGARDGCGYIKEFTTSHVSSSPWKIQEGRDGRVACGTRGTWREPHRIGFER